MHSRVHVFVAGASGAGKSTLLRTIMRRLINSNATDAAQKVGLVVLDFKGDETVEFIRSAAAAVGRAADVRVLSLDSAAGYDFFSGCKTLEDVAEYEWPGLDRL
jgi:ABC-type molybdenum transport system ATPase subunit/photorepair protein PhrA